jgi:hypothetical protein
MSFIGLFVALYLFYVSELPVMFSILGTLFWLGTGAADPTISTLLPKDPYSGNKKVAVGLAALYPATVAWWIGAAYPVRAVLVLSRLLAGARAALRFNLLRDNPRKPPGVNKFREWAQRALNAPSTWDGRVTVIDSDTSTGKTTELVAAVLEQTSPSTTVWLAVPYLILRDNHTNHMYTGPIDKLRRGQPLGAGRYKVATYGHLVARIGASKGPAPGDIILADELGEETPEMGLLLYHLPAGVGVIAMSATPTMRYCPNAVTLRTGIRRAFEVTTEFIQGRDGVLVAAALGRGATLTRALLTTTSIDRAKELVLALQKGGRTATAVHKDQRTIPKEGNVVGTPVIDRGIDADPPFQELIDGGLVTVSHKGRLMVMPTGPLTNAQRKGRVGRRGPGRAFQHPRAGTGAEPVKYPAWSRLFGSLNARKWMEEKLGINNPLEPVWHNHLDAYLIYDRELPFSVHCSFELLWIFRCLGGTIPEANRIYEATRTRGFAEEHTGFQARFAAQYGAVSLLPINELLDWGEPWRIKMGPNQPRTLGLRYENDTVVSL